MNITELLKQTEGKTLEFKQDFSSPMGILKTIIAFANTAGGTLLIGVEDGTKHIKGISDPLQLEEKIASVISDSIEPHIVPEIEIIAWRDNSIIAIEIFPSPNRPHYLKQKGRESSTYVRVGSTNRRADLLLIKEMERVVTNESFDEQAIPNISSEAIDFRAASEHFKSIKTLKRTDLESLGLVASHQKRKVATIAGILLFSQEKDKLFPDAWLQAGRFQGLNKKIIIDSIALNCYLIDALKEAMKFIEKHALQAINITNLQHEKQWSIPHAAVREALINAIVHTDYSQQGSPIRLAIFDDRIEIENPGLLPFGLTISDIKQGVSKLRNRVIGKVFNKLGYIEQWGSGVQRIIEICKEGGFVEPTFEEIGTHFRVTIPIIRSHKIIVDKQDQKILSALSKAKDGLATSQVADIISLTTRATRSRLIKLIERGEIVEIGSSTRDPNRRYHLAKTR